MAAEKLEVEQTEAMEVTRIGFLAVKSTPTLKIHQARLFEKLRPPITCFAPANITLTMIASTAVSPSNTLTAFQWQSRSFLLEATTNTIVIMTHNNMTFSQAMCGLGSKNNWVDIRRSA